MKQILEQFAHFIVFGFIAYLSTEVSIALLCYREFSSWWAPWPFDGQWPPGDTMHLRDEAGTGRVERWSPLDRVEDLRLDVVVSLGGIIIGNVVARMWPVWELIS